MMPYAEGGRRDVPDVTLAELILATAARRQSVVAVR